MPRYKLTIEYDGGPFMGWQRQAHGPSVQQVLEEAILAFCGEAVTVLGAGRTDAGVHALGQVVQADLPREYRPYTVRAAINHHLRPHPVAVVEAEPAPARFNARLSARERRYLYRILNRRAPPVLDRGRVWHVPWALDADAMAEAARHLVGHHDFSSFRAAECQATSPVRTLSALEVARAGDEIRVAARARSFLHHQVRNIVGTLVFVGEGRWTPAKVAEILAARDRRAAGPTAPPEGLYLVSVHYPDRG